MTSPKAIKAALDELISHAAGLEPADFEETHDLDAQDALDAWDFLARAVSNLAGAHIAELRAAGLELNDP